MVSNTSQHRAHRYMLACLAAAAAFVMTASAAQPRTTEQPRIAFAQGSPDSAPAARVRYDDLDLSTDQGTQTLYQRISKAAKMVCPSTNSRELAAVAAEQRCRAQAVARAVQDVNSPRLALVHATHTRHG
jgi:UrcA family protein